METRKKKKKQIKPVACSIKPSQIKKKKRKKVKKKKEKILKSDLKCKEIAIQIPTEWFGFGGCLGWVLEKLALKSM